MTAVEIYAHAEVLRVRARLVPASGTGHLETLILRAVAKGVSDIDDIADMFGISARLTLDVVGDLWREGRLAVDVNDVREALTATTKALDELEDLDEAGSLPSSYSVADSEYVLLDKLSGRVLPRAGSRQRPPDPTLVVDLAPDDPSRADLDQQAIDDAVAANLRDRHRGTDDRMDSYRVVGTTLPPPDTEPIHRFIPYRVEVSRGASGELSITVTDERIPLAQRELATKRLSGAIHSVPRPPFVQRLQGLVTSSLYKPRGLHELRGEFERAVDGLLDCAPANRQSRHDKLLAAAREIHSRVEGDYQHQMSVELLQTQSEHDSALHSLIQDAKRQLLLAVPWITETGIRPYLNDLQNALERGVRVVILWGIKSKGETLPQQVVQDFIALQRRAGGGGQLYYPSVPSHLHAKVVVADDRAALVTSRNYFSGSHYHEVGVRLDALPDKRCPVTEEILRWAHSVAPSQAVADQIAMAGPKLGMENAPLQLTPLPLPRFSSVLPGAVNESPEVALWLAGWKATRDQLLALLMQPDRPTVSLVIDGYHRTLALESFREAARRIVITSDGLSADALTSGMVSDARSAAARGIAVTMVHRAGRETGAEARTNDLKSPLDEDLAPPVVRPLKDWHGKVLVFDDSSVVGSYNFLSRDSTNSRGRSTGELSVRIDDPVIADQLASALRRKDQIEPRREGLRQASRPTTSAEATVTAQDFLELLASPDPDIHHAESLLTTHPPQSVLEALKDTAPAAYERALAALVATKADGTDWASWADELVQRAWDRGAWWAAATIARSLPKSASTQDSASLFQAVLAIQAGTQSAIGSLHKINTTLTVDQRDAAALYGAHQLLTAGAIHLFDPLAAWEPDCTPDIAQIVSLVRSVTVQHGFVGDQIGLSATTDAATARSKKAWHALDHAVSELRRYKPNTPPGNQLLSHIFGDGGEMQELDAIVSARDVTALRSWMDKSEEESSRWVARAGKRAGLTQPINGSQRNSFVKKHDALWLAAEATVSEDRPALEDAPDGLRAFEAQLADLLEQVATRPGTGGRLIAGVQTTLLSTIRGVRTAHVPGADRDDWRFPTLLLEEWVTHKPDHDRVARAVATDVFAQWTVSDAVSKVIRAGEYQLADELLTQDDTRANLTPGQADHLEDGIRESRRLLANSVSDAVGVLRSRADCAGVPLPAGEPRPIADEIQCRADVDQELASWQEKVELAVQDATREAQRDLAERLETLSSREAAILRSLIDEGDLVAARGLADDGELHVLGVLEPPSRLWPQRHISLSQVLFHLRNQERGAPTLREFAPKPGDKCGLAFVDALEGLETNEDRAAAVAAYADAIEGLISTVHHPKRELTRAGNDPETATFLTELAVAHPELPPFVWPGGSIKVAIGDDDNKEALVRISLRVAARADEPEVVDIAKALSLLAPVSGDHGLTETRATRFLRLICPQLELKDLVNVSSLGDLTNWRDRARLWALMDVLGLTLSDAAKASLLAIAGHHPHLMWHLIDTAMHERRDSSEVLKASTLETSRLLSRPDFDDIVDRAVREDITDRFEFAVLLAVAVWGYEDGIDEPLVRETLQGANVATPRRNELLGTLDSLVRRRYLDSPAPGLFRLPNTPLGRALARHDPQVLLDATAERLIAEAASASADLAHRWAQQFRTFYHGSELTGREVQDPSVPCDISRWAGLLANKDWTPTADPEDPPITVAPIIGADLRVRGPAIAVIGAIDNLLANAVAALLDSSTRRGELVLSVHDNGDGKVTVEVADNGPGLPDDIESGIRAGTLTSSEGRGLGLEKLLSDADSYGWKVTAGRHDVLGGASIRITLPRED